MRLEKIEIEEIKKYVDELVALLKPAGHAATADAILVIAERFKQPSEVRPAVYALDQLVRQWLRNPQGLQDPHSQLTAQFLVDACKNALSQGAIRSLPPTPRESARKLGRVAGMTLVVGVVLVLVPVVLLAVGFDWVALLMPERVAGVEVERGSERAIAVTLSLPAPTYDRAIEVQVAPAGHCRGPQWEELSCEQAERLWSDGVRHPTYHVVRPAEVSGLLIAVAGASLQGIHGTGTLLVYADKDTALGEYVIPLEGAYLPAAEPCVDVVDASVADASVVDVNTAEVNDADENAVAAVAGDAGAVGAPCGESQGEDVLPLLRSPISSVVIQVR